MHSIALFKEATVKGLFQAVPDNLNVYRNGTFEYLLSDPSAFINSSCQFDNEQAKNITCTEDDSNEVACCLGLSKALVGVTAYLARDERLWTRLSHIELIQYGRVRWPIPSDDEKAIAHIRKHFFGAGARGIERDNLVSRLWWMTEICSKVVNLSLEDALTAFLYQSDVRANIVERPTTSQNPIILSAVVNKLHDSYLKDKSLYERTKFRSVMKKLNIEGGTRLLEALDAEDIKRVVDKVSE
jgi:Family of unknown function (DUF6339)